MPIGLVRFHEPQRDLAGRLPLRPVFEQGVGIIDANVVELSESNTVRQVLGKGMKSPCVTSQQLVLLDLSVFDSLAFDRSPSRNTGNRPAVPKTVLNRFLCDGRSFVLR
jgi:hypothetical protein